MLLNNQTDEQVCDVTHKHVREATTKQIPPVLHIIWFHSIGYKEFSVSM